MSKESWWAAVGGWSVMKRRRQEGMRGKIKEETKEGKGKEKLGSEEEVED